MRFTEIISENKKPGLWANIHAKRDRIKNGSGEHMRKPGSKGAPTADALKKSATDEAANPKQQAAIAIAMKKAGKKPKGVTEQTVTETAEELQELTQFSKGMADFLAKSYAQYIKNPQTAKYVQQQISQPITDGAPYRALMPAIGIVSVPGADTYTSPGLELAKKFVNMVVAYFPAPGDADYNGFSEAAPAVYDSRPRTVVINKDYLSDPTYLASTIAHEVQHGIDDLKSRKGLSVKTDQQDLELSYYDQGKAFKHKQSAGATNNAQKYQSYLSMPHEVNARFTEVINDIKQRIEKEDIQNIGSAGLSELARSAFKQHYMHEVFPNGAKDPGYKRLLSRVYAWLSKYYNDRIDRYGSFKPQPATPVLDEQGAAEGQEQTPDQVRQTLNAWMNQDQQYEDPTERAPFQAQVWPYIQTNINSILSDKGKDGKGGYPAAPYAAWLLVQHMDAYPQNQVKFLQQLGQSGLNPDGKLQFLKDRAAVNQWIASNANKPEYFINGKPLPNPTVNVRNPAMFKDAGQVATSRKEALANAKQAGNKLLVAAVQATKAKTQPSYKQGVAEGLPGSLSQSDYTPGATVKNPNTSCKRCNGRGTLWKTTDGKILPANDVPGAKKYKCGACDGIGMAKKEVDESNEFTDARMNAIKANKDTFVVHGKTYKVTGDTTDEREASFSEGENWSKHNNKRAGGMSKKSVSVYRREHPGSKIQTAVTTKPSKLKKGSKAAKRRASFCARMRGMKKHRTGAKTAHDPNSNINKSLRRWHCESIEELHELVMIAEQFVRNNKK